MLDTRTLLRIPGEPHEVRAATRELLDRAPEDGLRLIDGGDWIARPLWEAWGTELEAAGWDEESFQDTIGDYRNELRLWVMGERPWLHVMDGLVGRLQRRTASRARAAGSRP